MVKDRAGRWEPAGATAAVEEATPPTAPASNSVTASSPMERVATPGVSMSCHLPCSMANGETRIGLGSDEESSERPTCYWFDSFTSVARPQLSRAMRRSRGLRPKTSRTIGRKVSSGSVGYTGSKESWSHRWQNLTQALK